MRGRLSGFSLLETLVATIVVLLLSAVASLAYVNLTKSAHSPAEAKAHFLCRAWFEAARSPEGLTDAEQALGPLWVSRTVRPYKDHRGVFWVHVEVLGADDQELAHWDGLVEETDANAPR